MSCIVDKQQRQGFKPGISGNPSGRPPISRASAARFREFLSQEFGDVDGLFREWLHDTRLGDGSKWLPWIARVVPPLKPVLDVVPVEIPSGITGAALANEIVLLAAKGNLSIEIAKEVIAMLAITSKLREAEELIPRLEALEKRL